MSLEFRAGAKSSSRLCSVFLCGVLLGPMIGSSGAQESTLSSQQSPVRDSSSTSQPTYLVAANGQSASSYSVAGPVRMARVSFLQGDVQWRQSDGPDNFGADDDAASLQNISYVSDSPQWNRLTLNLPVQEGTSIRVGRNARLELQFDEGSFLRLGSDTHATLRALQSDKEGAFTEVIFEQGVGSLHLRHKYSAFRVVTPRAALGAIGPAKLRVGVTLRSTNSAEELLPNAEFAVRAGQANVEARQGDITLEAGDYLSVHDKTSPYRLARLPVSDEWERWNDTRDRRFSGRARPAVRHLPSNIALVASDLDFYGTWRQDTRHGYVWCPRVATGWRPYSAGRWVNIQPWGWTWVSTEAWGWAPYHYGTWTSTQWGWAWVPGPSKQPWSPAVVSLSQSNGTITWVPLSPDEVRYPTILSSGFNRWDTYFSIPIIAAYCPAPSYPNHLYVAQPCYSYWGRPVIKTVNIYKGPVTIINKRRGAYPYPGRVKNIYKGPVTIINPPPKNSRKPRTKNPVIPVNVQTGGASSVPTVDFGKRHSHRRASASDVAHLSRKKLSLLSLQQDRSITSEASALAPGLLNNTKPKALRPSETAEQRANGQEHQAGKDKAQRTMPATPETPQDNPTQPRRHQERADARRLGRTSTERERPEREAQERDRQKEDNRAQERGTRQEQEDERRETQQREGNQQPQQRQEQERREREEREQRAQRERQEREAQERQEREAKQAGEQGRADRERQEKERRRAEQQNQLQPAPNNGDAGHWQRNGRRKDR